MDTLGFEPRAFRMRSGCDTTTPCALEETAGCGSHTPYQTSHPDSADVHHGNVFVMCFPQPWMLTTLQKSMLADQTHLLHIFGGCAKCFWACCRLFFANKICGLELPPYSRTACPVSTPIAHIKIFITFWCKASGIFVNAMLLYAR